MSMDLYCVNGYPGDRSEDWQTIDDPPTRVTIWKPPTGAIHNKAHVRSSNLPSKVTRSSQLGGPTCGSVSAGNRLNIMSSILNQNFAAPLTYILQFVHGP